MADETKPDCTHKRRSEARGLTTCADCGSVVVIDLMLVLKASLEAEKTKRHSHRFVTDEDGAVWPCACGEPFSGDQA